MVTATMISTDILREHTSDRPKIKTISKAVLCSIYGIIPLCLAIMFFDTFFFHGMMRKSFPYIPESLFVIAFLFADPHITGSFFSFYDKEYFARYKSKLLLAFLSFTIFVCIPPYFFGRNGWLFVYIILFIWGMEHVVGQQAGLLRMMTRGPLKHFSVWWWSGFCISIVLSLGVYIHAFLHTASFDRYIEGTSLAFILLLIASASSLHRQCNDAWGVRYLWLNCSLILTAFFAYLSGYLFFVLLMPRFVHDVTAFTFYAAHDQNRNAESANNVLYRQFQCLRISTAVLCPILAIAIAFPATYILHFGIPGTYHIAPKYVGFITDYFMRFTTIAGFLHYYTDSFAWKKESLHRRYISIA